MLLLLLHLQRLQGSRAKVFLLTQPIDKLIPEYSLSTRTIPIFERDLHFGPNYKSAEFHVCTSSAG